MEDLYNYVNPLNKRHSPMISKETLDIVLENKAVSHIWCSVVFMFSNLKSLVMFSIFYHNILYSLQRLNSAIIFDRDFSYNFFGFKVIFHFILDSPSRPDTLDYESNLSFCSNRLLSGRICWRLMEKVRVNFPLTSWEFMDAETHCRVICGYF